MSDTLLELLLNLWKLLLNFFQRWAVRLQVISSFSWEVTNHKFSWNWQHSLASFSSMSWWVFCQPWNFLSLVWVNQCIGNRNISASHSCIRTASNNLSIHRYDNKPWKYILLNQIKCILNSTSLFCKLSPTTDTTRCREKYDGKLEGNKIVVVTIYGFWFLHIL